MASGYIPKRDANLVTFADNFSSLITGSPAVYGLVAGDAAAIAAVTTAWDAAYALAVGPTTRTPATISAKDDARTALLAVLQPYAQVIANNRGVSPSLKIGLGINSRSNPPTPVPAPTTYPVITPVLATPLTQILRFRDYLSLPTAKAKPAGVVALVLFAKVSATPITDHTLLEWAGNKTKAPFQVSFTTDDVGKVCYYAGRWVTRKGLLGPWSAISSMTVA